MSSLNQVTEGLFPDLGQGLGLRPKHYSYVLEKKPKISWFEVITENFMGINGLNGGRPLENLEKIRRDYPIALHGVSLSIGSVDPLDLNYLATLKSMINRLEPALVSDHLCWTGVGGENLHDLLPLPYTQETIQHLVPRISEIQNYLGRQIVLENVSTYLTFKESEMTEWDFLNEISSQSGCGILLDVNNIYVSAINHSYDPKDFLNGVRSSSVCQFHLAGHSNMGHFLIDTHDQPICENVWALYEEALKLFGMVPTLIERDGNIPEFEELLLESHRAGEIQRKIIGKHKNSHPNSARTTSKLASLGHHAS